jgi:lipoprotein NlpD
MVRWIGRLAGVCAVLLLVGCAGAPHRPAPVEDRRPVSSPSTNGSRNAAPTSTAAALPGAENAGKPGFYTVRSGDTLIKIGLDQGQNWRDLVRWNGLDNPNVIEVGQVLRVAPPAGESVVVRPVSRPNANLPAASPTAMNGTPVTPPPGGATAPVTAPPATASSGAAATPPSADAPEDSLNFLWPATGPVLAGFDDPKNKGIDLGGKAGDPVLASADGRVVYAGSGLRGYGNLIIIKHNNVFLTAYAHNQTLLVKEDQAVKRGQKIAEMGNTDADQVKLHFEIRRQGKPIDPARYLPATR